MLEVGHQITEKGWLAKLKKILYCLEHSPRLQLQQSAVQPIVCQKEIVENFIVINNELLRIEDCCARCGTSCDCRNGIINRKCWRRPHLIFKRIYKTSQNTVLNMEEINLAMGNLRPNYPNTKTCSAKKDIFDGSEENETDYTCRNNQDEINERSTNRSPLAAPLGPPSLPHLISPVGIPIQKALKAHFLLTIKKIMGLTLLVKLEIKVLTHF